jgi:hypothetical protein
MFFIWIERRGEGIHPYNKKTKHKFRCPQLRLRFVGVTFLEHFLLLYIGS